MAAPNPVERAHQAGTEALRAAILDVAGDLLERSGPDALSMRTVAATAGCSTTVVYRLFGNKRGLIAALYREGFARLGRRMREAASRTADPRHRLAALGQAYRENALANRTYYGVMFGRPVPEFTPNERERAEAESTLAILESAVADALAAGWPGGRSPATIARALWAAVHGVVSLELAGHLTGQPADEIFELVSRGVGLALQPPSAQP